MDVKILLKALVLSAMIVHMNLTHSIGAHAGLDIQWQTFVQDAHRRAWGLPGGPIGGMMNVTAMAVASENLNALMNQMQVTVACMHDCCHCL